MDGKSVWTSRSAPSTADRRVRQRPPRPCCTRIASIVVNDNETQSFIAAFDKKTGKEIWQVRARRKRNWATPFVWENEQRTEIVTAGTGKVRSYDLDGKLLWELTGMTSSPRRRRSPDTGCSTSARATRAARRGRCTRSVPARPATSR